MASCLLIRSYFLMTSILSLGCQLNAWAQQSGPDKPATQANSPAEIPLRGASRQVPATQPYEPHYRASWAVIIGIDKYSQKYQDGKRDFHVLNFAVNDAQSVAGVLQNEFGSRIRLLVDAEATQANIRNAISDWPSQQKVQADDSFLVFFAGHGLPANELPASVAAVDSVATDPVKTCIEITWIRDQMARLPCQHKVLILDSCYSGAMFADDGKGNSSSPAKADMHVQTAVGTRGPGEVSDVDNIAYYMKHAFFWGISAGRDTPVADGLAEERHSVFTTKLLEVLHERANSPRPDHVFTFRQLAPQVEVRVANALKSEQIPQSGPLGPGDGDFVFRPTVLGVTPNEQRELTLRTAECRLIEQRASDAISRYPQRAALLAMEAYKRASNLPPSEVKRAEEVLRATLRNIGGQGFDCKGAMVNTLAASADGRIIAAGCKDGTVRLFFVDSGGNELGHQDIPLKEGSWVTALRFRSNARELIATDMDGNIWRLAVSDRNAGPAVCLSRGHVSGFIHSGAISADARWVATACAKDNTPEITLIDLQSAPIRVQSLTHSSSKTGTLAFAGDSLRLIVGGANAIHLFDLSAKDVQGSMKTLAAETGEREVRFGSVAFLCSEGNWIAAASRDVGWVLLWDRRSPNLSPRKMRFGRDRAYLLGLDLSHDGKRLAVASNFGTLVWNLAPNVEESVSFEFRDPVSSVSFRGQSDCIAATDGGDVLVYRVMSDGNWHKSPLRLRGHEADIEYCGFSEDGMLLLAGSRDGTARVWHFPFADRCVNPIHLDSAPSSGDGIWFTPDSQWLLTGTDNRFRLWSIRATTSRPPIELHEHGQQHLAIAAISPNGRWLLSSGKKQKPTTAELYDLNGLPGALHSQSISLPRTLLGGTFSNDNLFLAIGSDSITAEPSVLQVCDLKQKLLMPTALPRLQVVSAPAVRSDRQLTMQPVVRYFDVLQFTQDSKTLLAASSFANCLELWKWTDGGFGKAPRFVWLGSDPLGFAVVDATNTVFVGGKGHTEWFDLANTAGDITVSRPVEVLDGMATWSRPVTVSRDRVLVPASNDSGSHVILIYQTRKGESPILLQDRILGDLAGANILATNRTRERFVSADRSGKLRLWQEDESTGSFFSIVLGDSNANKAAFSADDLWVATCGNESSVQLFQLNAAALVERLTSSIGRTLREDEKANYLPQISH